MYLHRLLGLEIPKGMRRFFAAILRGAASLYAARCVHSFRVAAALIGKVLHARGNLMRETTPDAFNDQFRKWAVVLVAIEDACGHARWCSRSKHVVLDARGVMLPPCGASPMLPLSTSSPNLNRVDERRDADDLERADAQPIVLMQPWAFAVCACDELVHNRNRL